MSGGRSRRVKIGTGKLKRIRHGPFIRVLAGYLLHEVSADETL
jgi:hypothetical protein